MLNTRKHHAIAAYCALIASLGAPAYAYLEPGTGSMLLQLILGGVAGVGIAVKLYWQQISSIFRASGRKSGVATSELELDHESGEENGHSN